MGAGRLFHVEHRWENLMIRQDNIETRTLTPKLAKWIHDLPHWAGERKLSPSRLKFLERKLRGGLFHGPAWAVANVNGEIYRMNGQHSSAVLIQNPDLFPKGLMASIEHFVLDNHDELPLLFSQFDSKASARSRTDVTWAYVSQRPELLSLLTRGKADLAAGGIAYGLDNGINLRRYTQEERAELLWEHEEFVIWCSEFVPAGKRRFMARVPVLAAVFRTYGIDDVGAQRFWRWVRDDDYPQKEHPTRNLREYLYELAIKSPTDRQHSRFGYNLAREIYVKCLHSWNAYCDGKTTKLYYRENTPVPKLKTPSFRAE